MFRLGYDEFAPFASYQFAAEANCGNVTEKRAGSAVIGLTRFDRYILSQLMMLFGFFALVLVMVYWVNRAVVLSLIGQK